MLHSVADGLPVLGFTLIGCSNRLGRKGRSAATSMALVTAAALLVHVWNGQIEAHFLFFVNLSLLTAYQDWLPFLLALGYVVLHHGADGIETAAQADRLRELGCPLGQGFLYARPAPAAELAGLLGGLPAARAA